MSPPLILIDQVRSTPLGEKKEVVILTASFSVASDYWSCRWGGYNPIAGVDNIE